MTENERLVELMEASERATADKPDAMKHSAMKVALLTSIATSLALATDILKAEAARVNS